MSPRPAAHAPIATTSTDIEAAFPRDRANWRTIAIKQALKELAGTLSSVLSALTVRDDRGHVVRCSTSEEQLLQLIPALVSEAVRVQHLDTITVAIHRLQLGHAIDLVPLVQAALADLAAVDHSQRVTATDEETSP